MKMRNIKLGFLLVILIFASNAFAYKGPKNGHKTVNTTASKRANCRPGIPQKDLDINNVRARLLTGGDLWWDGVGTGLYIVPKPAEGQPAVSSIFAGGVWIGGRDKSGNLKVAGVTYRDQNTDFDWYPGPLDRKDGTTDQPICKNWDRFFTVYGDEIRQHNARFEACQNTPGCNFNCDSIPENVLYWPGNANPYWGDKYDFPIPDSQLDAFWDEDGDGIYDPCKGDFPTIEIRGCEPENRKKARELVPDQMIFWIYNDNGGPHLLTTGDAIKMEVQVQAFSYATNDEVNDMTFYRYKMINRADADIIDCYFAMWADPDLGCSDDDYVGCDMTIVNGQPRSIAYTYNEDAVDGNSGATCAGGVNTYGENIPMVGTDYFRGPLGPKVYFRDAEGKIVYPITLLDPIPGTGDLDTLIELGMTSFIYMNRGGQGIEPATQDPENTDDQFYNCLKGLWRTGEPIKKRGTGYNPAAPNDSITKFVYLDPPNKIGGWSMAQEKLGTGDRRTLQATGPLLLQPGAINELIIGAVWVPDVTHPRPDIAKLMSADDVSQALFDNCFDITDGPDAPDITCAELDKQLILALSNDELISNNAYLRYEERDLRTNNDTVVYKFEGYKVFQLADPSVSAQEINDVNKARLVFQTDLRNGVTEIFNWVSQANPNTGSTTQPSVIWTPVRKVVGGDKGIQSTFSIIEDQFASGARQLVNHKAYHFMVLAYAYNNYLEFNPKEVTGQKNPYLEGRGNIMTYSFVPRPIVYENLNAVYGEGAVITRLSGQGSGENFLDISKETREKLAKGEITDGKITYKDGAGPINVKIYNPLEILDGKYQLDILGTFDSNSKVCALKNDAKYVVTDLNTGQEIVSATSLQDLNEQIIYKKGFSITVGQSKEPGFEIGDGQKNGAIIQILAYDNPSGSIWFNTLVDGSNGLLNVLGPTLSNLFDPIQNESTLDPKGIYSKFGSGNFFPFALSRLATGATGELPFVTPTSIEAHPIAIDKSSGTLKLQDLNNVDIVFTPDKSLWSRCIVVETASTFYTNTGRTTADGCKTLEVRTAPSVGKDGIPDGTGVGFSYFPGYAIDVETGERLNIFFGENTIFRGDDISWLNVPPGGKVDYCTDMIFNPSSTIFGNGTTNNPAEICMLQIAGGQHNIYVTRQRYDECKDLAIRLKKGTNSFNKKNPLGAITWTALPLATNSFPMKSIAEGLIPNELVVKLRVNSAYSKERLVTEISKIPNCVVADGFPSYQFEFKGKQSMTLPIADSVTALSNINVVPNPYYAYSGYETSQFTNVVKITNLPSRSTITIYSLDGKFVRKFERDEIESPNTGNNPANKYAQEYPDLEWDMKNFSGIPVASGVYLIHVYDHKSKGERTLKWFGINRKFDPTGL